LFSNSGAYMSSANPIPQLEVPRHGSVTLSGYGIKVLVDRGHLLIEDGIAADRKRARLPRIGHKLKRLVVIGSDGMVSLAALRWLADQEASFLMLERDGKILLNTGPSHSSDARLRRAQGLALTNGVALKISRELISAKLEGQAMVIREVMHRPDAANVISQFRLDLAVADTFERIRLFESQAARVYWSAWSNVPILYPREDIARIPEHWKTFGQRVSVLTASPRLATNPPNAILNYCYAVLESECRLAVSALGLDPSLGVLHTDTPARDSLACDLMEVVRPKIDAWLLNWIKRDVLARSWFFETRQGNCRLMAPLATKLSETASTWRKFIAPWAEYITRELWGTRPKRALTESLPPTRLTQQRKREVKGSTLSTPTRPAPTPARVCQGCGGPVTSPHDFCQKCALPRSKASMVERAKIGRVLAHSPKAQRSRIETMRRHDAERKAWLRSGLSKISEEEFTNEIQPKLIAFTNAAIARALGVSIVYASHVRHGRRRPHPRHWKKLAELIDVSQSS
jgi:CRISPR-associated endonuclease Cas1